MTFIALAVTTMAIMSAEETIGFASTQLHPGRQLTLRLMELLDPETFEKFQVLLGDKISPQILENIEVESSYNDVSPGDNILKRRKFFKALEHQYGEDELIDLLRNVVVQADIYTTERDQTVNFKVLLDEYAAKLKDYHESKRSKGLLEDSGFVGREKYIEELKKDLTKKTSNITGVLICGMFGIGKTSLANHLCYMLGEYRALRVDFRAVEDIGQAYRHIMFRLGKMVDTTMNIDLLKSALTETQTETILFLDNVDTLSDPASHTAGHFMSLLRNICSVSNSKVKLLLTSRHKMTKEDRITSFEARTERVAGHIIEYELRQLNLDECRQIFRTIAPDCQAYTFFK